MKAAIRQRAQWIGIILVVMAAPALAADAKQELDEQVSAYQKAGEPIEPADFVTKGVAEKDNAVLSLQAAWTSIIKNAPTWKSFNELSDLSLPLTDAQSATIRAAVQVNPSVFMQVDEAMKRPSVDWQIAWVSPVMETLLPQLSEMRGMARLISARALLNHQSGDDAAAIADVQRVIFFSRTTGKMPTFVAHLVSIGIMGMATDAITQMSPDLHIGGGREEVSAQTVQSLIGALLNDTPQRDGQQLALFSERMSELDCVRCMVNGTLDFKKLAGPAGKPVVANPEAKIDPQMAWTDTLIMLRYMTSVAEAARAAQDWQTLTQLMPPMPEELDGKERAQHVMLSLFLPSTQGFLKRGYQAQTDRSMAAVAVATRWYSIDHQNNRPATLDDLVPKYLPSVPHDPMVFDQPLKYESSDKRWIVYSVGEDGINDGGTDKAGPNKKNTPPLNRWQAFDAVLHLDRQPKPAP